jgi:hypothetical protein
MLTEAHVVPIADTREHVLAADCWCLPEASPRISPESYPIYIHFANDMRQVNEIMQGCGPDEPAWEFVGLGEGDDL